MLATRPLWIWALTASCCSLLACGGKSQTEQFFSDAGKSAGGADAEVGGAGGKASGGSQGGGPAAGGTQGGGPAAGGSQCAQFNEAEPQSVRVVIRNDTQTTLHVGQPTEPCYDAPLFQVRDDEGELLEPPGYCRIPCESQMSLEPSAGCTADCPGAHTVTLLPGEEYHPFWDALYQVQTTMPKGCYPNHPDYDQPSLACDKTQRITPGAYSFTASAGTVLDCYDATSDCGPCLPNDNGGCTTHQAWVGGELRVAKISVSLDASYGVGDSGGEKIGANNVVEIIFRD